jgi:hypothetical protein
VLAYTQAAPVVVYLVVAVAATTVVELAPLTYGFGGILPLSITPEPATVLVRSVILGKAAVPEVALLAYHMAIPLLNPPTAPLAAEALAFDWRLKKVGIATADRIPNITMTITSSINVKPLRMLLLLFYQALPVSATFGFRPDLAAFTVIIVFIHKRVK